MNQIPYTINTKPTALWPNGGTAVLKTKPKRVIVFVDGSNWYYKLRELLNTHSTGTNRVKPPINFDLHSLMSHLIDPDMLTEIRYYIGKVRRNKNDAKSELLYANQQRLIGYLQDQHVKIGFGHLINYPDGSFHEKGVDILLAVEMIRCFLEKRCDIALLVSSDTDLVPAVDECKRIGGEIFYVGSSLHGPSFGLAKACNRTILLQPKDILPYMPV